MNTILLANLVDRLHPSQGFQAYLRLECGCVDFPLLRFAHYAYLHVMEYSLNYCLENRVHYTTCHLGQKISKQKN